MNQFQVLIMNLKKKKMKVMNILKMKLLYLKVKLNLIYKKIILNNTSKIFVIVPKLYKMKI